MHPGKRRLSSPVLTAVALLSWIWFVMPAALQAGQKLGARERGRFRVDLYGGYSFLDPSDLNQIVDYDKSVQEFTYDAYFDYLRDTKMIRSWNKNTAGEWKKIKNAIPFGLRIRYAVLDFFDVSVGFQHMRRGASGSLNFRYTRNELSDVQYIESLDIAPHAVEVKAFMPFVGIHFRKRLGRLLTAEGFAAGGPLFAECSYESQWHYTWTIQGQGYSWETYKSEGVLEEDGSGTGIALEIGGRISIPVLRRIDVFLESGYAYQVVKSLSGSGVEIQGENTQTWEGKWGMKSETMTTPWGMRDLLFPTNNKTDGTEVGDFRLDFSGFRIRIGVSLGF